MNIQSMMAQAKKMQKDIEEKQNTINNTEYMGNSEWVSITMLGNYSIKKVDIKRENLDETDIEALGDMIMLAFNDAKTKIEQDTSDKMGQYANLGGLM